MSEGQSSLWASAGLFVATVLASQMLQRSSRRREESTSSGSTSTHNYFMKRTVYQLSYTDLPVLDGGEAPRRKTSVDQNLESGDNVYDFHPKNSNWTHFETEAEGEESIQLLEDENVEDDQDLSEGSSEGEEAFLWTSSASFHRKRRNSVIRRERSWTDRLKEPIKAIKRTLSGSFLYGSDDDEQDGTVVPWGDTPPPPATATARHKRLHSAPEAGHYAEPQLQNRAARAKYNARIMPNKVVMLRHGQSMGNVDDDLFSTTPDSAMPLTKLGWEQARKSGQVLKEKVLDSGESVHFIVSPYVRSVETFHGIVSAWCDPSEFRHIQDRDKRLKAWYGRLLELGLTWHEDPRIREQDFGNYQDPVKIRLAKKERYRFGTFFYRFAHGESAADVFDRVSTFLDSLWRSFYLNRSRNYVLITHGIAIRVFMARYFRYTIDQFSMLANPKNCEMVILRHDGAGRLQLEGRCEQDLETDDDGETHVTGCTFYERLRVLPSQWVRKTKIRISYDD